MSPPIGSARAGVVSQAGDAIPDSGVLRYEFEQNVNDSWNGYDGTDNTSAGYSTDSAVGSYSKVFDGSDDHIPTGLNPNTYGFTEISVSAWVKLEGSGEATIWNARTTNDMEFRRDGGDSIEFYTFDGNTHEAESSTLSWDSDTWYHVVGVYDGSEYRVYRNGSLLASNTSSSFTLPDTESWVGERTDGGGNVDGQIDDLRIYDKGLTDSEVSNLYNTDNISG